MNLVIPVGAPPRGGREPFWGYADVLILLVGAVVLLLVSSVAVTAVVSALHVRSISPLIALVAGQSLGYALLLALASALFRTQYRKPFLRSVGFVRPNLRFRTAVLVGQLLALAIAALAAALGSRDWNKEAFGVVTGSNAFWLVALAGTTLYPFAEEAFFRGVLQPLVVRSLGAPLGVAIPALAYTVMLLPQYGWTWRCGALALASGIWGWIRHKTGSTTAAAVVHAAYNATYFMGMVVLHVGMASPRG